MREASPQSAGATRQSQSGFTLTEMLTGMVISVLMLAGIMNLFLMASRSMQQRQQVAQVSENLQTALQQMVNEVRWAVTRDPRASGAGANALPFSQLPQLPYNTINSAPPTGPVLPAVPALGKFDYQLVVDSNSPSAKYFVWFPNPMATSAPLDQNANQGESNYMTFYKVDRDIYHQITYRLEGQGTNDPQLIKEDRPYNPATGVLEPPPASIVLLHHVKSVQFTYPLLLEKIRESGFDATLEAKRNLSQTDLDEFLNQNYRGVVDIRLSCYVPKMKQLADGSLRLDAAASPTQESRVQVSVRN